MENFLEGYNNNMGLKQVNGSGLFPKNVDY